MGRLYWVVAGSLAIAATGAWAKPEDDIITRHKGLTAALNRMDTKALRGFYAPNYRTKAQGQELALDQSLKIMEAVKQQGVKIRIVAALSKIKVTGTTATALETADITFIPPQGKAETRKGEKSAQKWVKQGGVWKLQSETSQ